MQWPVWPREIVIKASGMIDRKNNGCLIVLKSIDEGQKFFNVPSPKTSSGYVRIDIIRGYHYLQRIDDNTTKYITIFNTDPKISMIPSWFLNFILTKICY